MLGHSGQTKGSMEENHRQNVARWEWRSFLWVGEALIILMVPGGLAWWLGRVVWKRGKAPSGYGVMGVGSNWIQRRLAWASNPVQKIIR